MSLSKYKKKNVTTATADYCPIGSHPNECSFNTDARQCLERNRMDLANL
jgi:hypothetical protein